MTTIDSYKNTSHTVYIMAQNLDGAICHILLFTLYQQVFPPATVCRDYPINHQIFLTPMSCQDFKP